MGSYISSGPYFGHFQPLFQLILCIQHDITGLLAIYKGGSRELSRYSDSLRTKRSGDRIPVGARFSAPVLLYNGYRVIPGDKAAGACR
jgi:hypothetical protein